MSNYTIPTPKDRMMFVDVTPKGESRTYERVGKGFDSATPRPGTYKAKKYNVVVDCTNDGGGAVADGLLIEGIIYVNGDPVEGTFVEATKTFTEGMAE